MKILVASDLHLGARLFAWGDQASILRSLLEEAWEEMVGLVLDPKENLDALLVAGDLFDEPDPSPELQARVFEGLERLTAHGKTAVIVPGVYDAITSPRSLYLRRPWPRGIHPVTWTAPRSITVTGAEESVEVVTAVWAPGSDLPLVSSPTTRAGRRIGLFHPGGESRAGWGPPLERDAVAEWELDLLVLGGEHERTDETWEATRVLSPGSPAPLTPHASRDRVWNLVTLTDQGIEIETRSRSLPTLSAAPDRPAPDAGIPVPSEGATGIQGAFVEAIAARRRRAGSDTERELLDRALAEGLRGFERAEAAHVD